jgi:pimeloyl-ACP methyl ester carboxylesterase
MRIKHGRVVLALHELARRPGPSLLLLHALFGSSAQWGETPAAWPGPVYGLDFAGHGRSQWLSGGGYYPELLAGDVDAVLATIGPSAVAGAGLGAYVALLIAGARPDLVPAALLLPGAGLEGGGAVPDFQREFHAFEPSRRDGAESVGCDPLVDTLAADIRPVDYTQELARAARRVLLAENGSPRPPWWDAVRRGPSAEVVAVDLTTALRRLSQLAGAISR